jgi:hypothetical protein
MTKSTKQSLSCEADNQSVGHYSPPNANTKFSVPCAQEFATSPRPEPN